MLERSASSLGTVAFAVQDPELFSNNATNTVNKRIYEPQVRWLREMAKRRPGYADFKRIRNRASRNIDVVKSWIFAVEFCEEYNKSLFEGVTYQHIHSRTYNDHSYS
jgi:hypothetical protein